MCLAGGDGGQPARLQKSGLQDLQQSSGADATVQDIFSENLSYSLKLDPHRVERRNDDLLNFSWSEDPLIYKGLQRHVIN